MRRKSEKVVFLYQKWYNKRRNPRWNGSCVSYHNLEPWQRAVYGHDGWEPIRKLVYERQNGMCADCGKPLLLHGAKSERKSIMEVHHTEPLTPENHDDPKVAFDVDGLAGLCHECHEARHGRLGTYRKHTPASRRGVWFDADGMPHGEDD